ncbi:MAG: hypothetical protein RLN60_04170 [Phycisphaerales bacterium]
MHKQRPTQEYRVGTIKAATWTHTDDDRTRTTVRFTRLYRADGKWRSTTVFDVRDLLQLSELAASVHRDLAPVTRSVRDAKA